jgi:hypothetical protein
MVIPQNNGVDERTGNGLARETTVSDPQLAMYRLWSRRCAVGLYVVAALWGTLQLLCVNTPGVYLLTGLTFALLATSWAVFDAKSRGKAILPVLQMLYFFMWPIGATVYLVARNGWRGLLIAILHGMGLTLMVCFTFYVTFYSLHYAGALDPRYYP